MCLLLLQPSFLRHNMHFSMPSMYSVHGSYQALLNNASGYDSQASNSPAYSEVIYFSPILFYLAIHSFKVPFYFMVPFIYLFSFLGTIWARSWAWPRPWECGSHVNIVALNFFVGYVILNTFHVNVEI